MKIFFWQNLQAFHQGPYIDALSTHRGVEVTWVAERQISEDRIRQGWPTMSLPNVRSIIAPTPEQVASLCSESAAGDVHLLSGPRGFPLSMQAIHELASSPATVGIVSENRHSADWRVPIRNIQYAIDRRTFAKRVDFALISGFNEPYGGGEWFRRRGYPAERTFPFAYFPPTPSGSTLTHRGLDFPVRLLYIGQLIPRKGVDILIEALAKIRDLDWALRIIGDGHLEASLKAKVSGSGLGQRIAFEPSLPNDQAMAAVENADLFILPSRFDGWGVGVNEALLRGVPAICSDRCGSKDLLGDSLRGETFRSASPASLADVLRRRISGGPVDSSERASIRTWAQCIQGEAGAKYLLEVIHHIQSGGPRPTAPWFAK